MAAFNPTDQERMQSEIDAWRKDRDDPDYDCWRRYGIISPGGVAHRLSSAVGLVAMCGRTARLYMAKRDIVRMCKDCQARKTPANQV